MPIKSNKLHKLHKRYPEKRAVITGAGSGLGKALALELARHGWSLMLNDQCHRKLEQISATCRESGGQVYSAVFNVANLEGFHGPALDFLGAENGVDLVFCCAGIGLGGKFLDTTPEHFQEVIDVNLMGTIWAGKVFLPGMAAAGKGHFITVASAAAFHGLPHLAGYAATKAAVVQLSETLRSEMKPLGVDVTVKMTTFYTSDIAEHTRGPAIEQEKARSLVEMAPWNAEDVADALLLHVQKRKFYMVAPTQARFLWRFKRFLPEVYLRLMPMLFAKLEARLFARFSAEKGGSSD